MRLRLFRLLTSLLLLYGLGLAPAAATHLVGGEIIYSFLDANGPAAEPYRYRITAQVYFDPNGGSIAPDGRPAVRLSVYRNSSGGRLLLSANVTRQQYELVAASTLPGCSVRFPYATLALYDTTVTLPVANEGYIVRFSESARNSVTNLESSTRPGMSLRTTMTPGTIPNSSPRFFGKAFQFICQGEPIDMPNTAYDAEGDRLSYQLTNAYSGGAQLPVALFAEVSAGYAPGYSAPNPFGRQGTLTLNAATGLSQYQCPLPGVYELALNVQEYRRINGQEVLLSTVHREIQVVVQPCPGPPNTAPAFVAPTPTARELLVAAGQTLDFTISATDAENQPLTTTVSSRLLDGPGGYAATFAGAPGMPIGTQPTGTVVLLGTGSTTGTFSLLTQCDMVRPEPYEVVVTVTDQACASKTSVAVFRITVVRPLVALRVRGDSLLCPGGRASYTAAGPAAGPYRWSVRGGQLLGPATGASVQVQWADEQPGAVSVNAANPGGCPTDSAVLAVAFVPPLAVGGPLEYCPGAFRGLRYTVAGPAAAYQWSLSNGTLISGQGTNEVVIDVLEDATAVLQISGPGQPACTTTLRIAPDNRCLAFYNIMTPNGDGRNDVFTIRNVERHPNTALTIFNRWGRQLYHSPDYRNGFGAEGLSAGVYYYRCRLTDGTTYKGWFEVMR